MISYLVEEPCWDDLCVGDGKKIIRTLNLMSKKRTSTFSIKFHSKFVDFMISEKGLKTESLKFGAKLIEVE